MVDEKLPPFDEPIPTDFNHLHFEPDKPKRKSRFRLAGIRCNCCSAMRTTCLTIRRCSPSRSQSWSLSPAAGSRNPVAGSRKPTAGLLPKCARRSTASGGSIMSKFLPASGSFPVRHLLCRGVDRRRLGRAEGRARCRQYAIQKCSLVLFNPKNDAEDVAAALRSLDFEVVLTVDASKRDFDVAMTQFARLATGADAALFSTPVTPCSIREETI